MVAAYFFPDAGAGFNFVARAPFLPVLPCDCMEQWDREAPGEDSDAKYWNFAGRDFCDRHAGGAQSQASADGAGAAVWQEKS